MTILDENDKKVERGAGLKAAARSFISSYWTLLIGVLFVLVGLAIIAPMEKMSFYQKLVYGVVIEVGFAFIIAWLVGLLVERGARQEYNEYVQKREDEEKERSREHLAEREREISRNVFSYLYNVNLSRELFKIVQQYIFEQPVVKTKQFLEYELISPEDPSSEWLKMKCYFDYTLKNVSAEPIDHSVIFYTSDVVGEDAPDLDGVGLLSVYIGDEAVPPEEFEDLDAAAEDAPGVKRYSKVKTIQSGEEVRVEITAIQLKRVDDDDLWQSSCVCDSCELKFKFDPELFNVFLEPVHPQNSFDQSFPIGPDNCVRVRISRPLLPKNGIYMWWNRKREPISGDSAA